MALAPLEAFKLEMNLPPLLYSSKAEHPFGDGFHEKVFRWDDLLFPLLVLRV